jgi:DNA-binding transcriptional LysR family regulator
MTDPRLLRTFLTVAAGLSFRQAAKDLHYAPSSVSSQIRSLEEELGVALFDRTGRNVMLTEQGRRLLGHARRLTELADQTRRIAAGDSDDPPELTVRLSETLGIHCLPWVLPLWRARHPDTRLTLLTRSRYGLARDVRHGLTDLGLILGEPFAAVGLAVTVLRRERLVVIVAPGSPLAGRGRVGPADLAGVDLLLTPQVWSARGRLEGALLEVGITPRIPVSCASLEMVRRCVMAGLGVSVAPWFAVAEAVAQGRLAALAWTPGPLTAPLLLIRDAARAPTAPALDLVAAVEDFCRARDRDPDARSPGND